MADHTVDVAWVADHLSDRNVRIIEVDASPTAYQSGHIPGAVFWDAYKDLRDAGYQPVTRDELASLLASSGIRRDTTVVTYGYAAALGFWLLTALGHDDVRMLLGPRDQWAQAGQPWETEPASVGEGEYSLEDEVSDVLATREDVERAISDPNTQIVDVRSTLEYNGERFWPSGAAADAGRTGHVPNAVSVPIDRLRTDDGVLRSVEELRSVFDDAGVSSEKNVITYCTIGNRASQAWFALKYLLGYPHVRVYYGSWVDWGKRADTPIESEA